MKKYGMALALVLVVCLLSGCSASYDGMVSGPAKETIKEVIIACDGYFAGVVTIDNLSKIVDSTYETLDNMDPKDTYDGDALKLSEAQQSSLKTNLLLLQSDISLMKTSLSTIRYVNSNEEEIAEAKENLRNHCNRMKERIAK